MGAKNVVAPTGWSVTPKAISIASTASGKVVAATAKWSSVNMP